MEQLKGRSLLTLSDYTKEEIDYLIDLAIEMKRERRTSKRLEGKNIVLISINPQQGPAVQLK